MFVPNHALGHTVESVRLGLALKDSYNLIFVAEQKAGDLLKRYGFKVITLPEREMFTDSDGIFFDGYIEHIVQALIQSIKPNLIISNHPCFTFSIPNESNQLEIPHIGIYGQFSRNMMKYLTESCDCVICTVPPCFSYYDSPKVKFVGPFVPIENLNNELKDTKYQNLFTNKVILVGMGGGGYRVETLHMLKTVSELAKLKPSYNFACVGDDDIMKFDASENVYKLGVVSPEIMDLLERKSYLGLVRAGKTSIELASFDKPVIALSLPNKKEQIQRAQNLANSGGAEHIKYDDLTLTNLIISFERIEQSYQTYATMMNNLNIHSGLPQALQTIYDYINPGVTNSIELHSRIYPFPLGVIQVKNEFNKVIIIAEYDFGRDTPPQDLQRNWTDEKFATLFITPDWLLSHSPYLLRQKLGCSPEERNNYSRPILIHQKKIFNGIISSEGVLNNLAYTSQYQINQHKYLLKLEIAGSIK